MSARIVEGIFTCTKRWALEALIALRQPGIFTPPPPVRGLSRNGHKHGHEMVTERTPMSAIECILRVLCWIDQRGDPSGRLFTATPAEIELAAAWRGKPGVLVTALIETGWIDDTAHGLRWHDYHRLNGDAIKARNKQRRRRANTGDTRGGTKGGTPGGNNRGDPRGYDRGTSESGKILKDLPRLQSADAPGAADAPQRAAPNPKPEPAEPLPTPPGPLTLPPHPALSRLASAHPPAKA